FYHLFSIAFLLIFLTSLCVYYINREGYDSQVIFLKICFYFDGILKGGASAPPNSNDVKS
uniref:hypothetical protein n=1 Tax=Phascolarctobacterium succinatutens TaxID=626940 RepID=UPI0026EE899B